MSGNGRAETSIGREDFLSHFNVIDNPLLGTYLAKL